MSNITRCKAVQYSDEMVCNECGLRWDTNDQDPPQCNSAKTKRPSETVALIGFMTAKLACYEPGSETVKRGLDWLEKNARK